MQHVAIAIGDELDEQNALLGTLDEEVGTTHSRLHAAQRKTALLLRTSGGWAWPCAVFGLTVLLMLLIAVAWHLL